MGQDSDNRAKYIEFIDIYAGLTNNEYRRYQHQYREDSSTMAGVIQRARDEGRVEGERTLLETLLRQRFGLLSPEVAERLGRASAADLETWAENVLEAPKKWPRKFEQRVKVKPIGIGAHWHGEKDAVYDGKTRSLGKRELHRDLGHRCVPDVRDRPLLQAGHLSYTRCSPRRRIKSWSRISWCTSYSAFAASRSVTAIANRMFSSGSRPPPETSRH